MRALLLLLFPILGFAQETLIYTGSPMTGAVADGFVSGPYDDTVLSGTVVLATPLDPNKANQVVVPTSYQFGKANLFLASSWRDTPALVGSNSTTLFEFSTANGLIIQWSIMIYATPQPNEAVNEWGAMTSSGNDAGFGADVYSYFQGPNSCLSSTPICTYYSASNMTPGTWQVVLPPPSVIPANMSALYCVNGSSTYKLVKPSNSTSSAIRSPTGQQTCALPGSYPKTYSIKTSVNGGGSWQWTLMSSLGLGNG